MESPIQQGKFDMSTTQKQCPMCAEEIPLTSETCEYCGAHFEVTSTGYCQNCHQVRVADEKGKCKVCDNAVLDWHVQSRFIEEPTTQAVRSVPVATSIIPKPHRVLIWTLSGLLALGIIGVVGVFLWLSKGSLDFLSILPVTNTPTAELVPTSTSTLVPTRTQIPTPKQPVWKRLSIGQDFPGSVITEIVVNPIDPKIMFFGAQEDPYGRQTYLSIDQGQRWQEISAAGHNLVYNADGTILYRGGHNKILFSKDNGQSWSTLHPAANGTLSIATHPVDPAVVFALYKNRADPIFFSEDGGQTWTNAKGGFIKSNDYFPQLFFSRDGNVIYSPEGPSRSGDGGRNWQKCGGWEITARISVNQGSASAMVVDPSNSDTVYAIASSTGIRITRDKCQTWNRIDRGLSNQLVNTIAVDPDNPKTLYAGTANNGAYVSFNSGAYWEPINDGLPGTSMIYSIVVDSQSNVYAATSDGLFKLESLND